MSALSLDDLKDHLNKATTAADDAELQDTLDAAEAHVAARCGAFGGAETPVTAHLSGDQLVLPATRLASIVEVRDPDGDLVALDAGAANLLSGIVRVPYRRAGGWTVTVTRAQAIPPDLKLAVLIIAAHLWETQRVPGAGQQGFGQPAAARPGAAWAIPNRAATLMGPYLVPVIA